MKKKITDVDIYSVTGVPTRTLTYWKKQEDHRGIIYKLLASFTKEELLIMVNHFHEDK